MSRSSRVRPVVKSNGGGTIDEKATEENMTTSFAMRTPKEKQNSEKVQLLKKFTPSIDI